MGLRHNYYADGYDSKWGYGYNSSTQKIVYVSDNTNATSNPYLLVPAVAKAVKEPTPFEWLQSQVSEICELAKAA